ncbi:hypothetical protein KJZ63_03665 [Patescibacteria group bacterium]|nr:hypothetical protein [Patescibacteria group bacterium]
MQIRKFAPTILSLRLGEKYYGLFLIEKGEDESLYIKFPRKKPYIIKSKNEYIDVPKTITFKKNEFSAKDPYFSYHQSGLVHSNLLRENGKKQKYTPDKLSSKKLELLKVNEFLPFCSVLFPINTLNYDLVNHLEIGSFNYHEISNKPLCPDKNGLKAPTFIAVDRRKIPENAILYIETYIHKKLLYDSEELCFSQEQRKNMLEQITFDNELGCLSFTLLVKYIQAEKENPLGEIIINFFSKESIIALSMY